GRAPQPDLAANVGFIGPRVVATGTAPPHQGGAGGQRAAWGRCFRTGLPRRFGGPFLRDLARLACRRSFAPGRCPALLRGRGLLLLGGFPADGKLLELAPFLHQTPNPGRRRPAPRPTSPVFRITILGRDLHASQLRCAAAPGSTPRRPENPGQRRFDLPPL